MTPEAALGHDFESVELRRRDDDSGQPELSISNYLYLRQAYDTLLRNSAGIPRDLGDELSRNLPGMDNLVGVRNRVMHGRPLRVDDLENTYAYLSLFNSRYFGLTTEVMDRLKSDKSWEPTFETTPSPLERVLHNLPTADHEETGLIGRAKDLKSISDLLLTGRDRMITVTGEGGIGKTALALQLAYQMVDATEPLFEAVLWVSLKNEVLTPAGVRSISNALRDITGATVALGKALDNAFDGSIEELSDYLSGLRCLIIIDNLESVQGTEVLRLYDALPESVTFLFTSRVGIGQVERRFPLEGLHPEDATLLFRKFAARRQQTGLAGLDPERMSATLSSLRFSPLAIRWFILCVESGRTPTDTLRNQSELLKFCVDNVYEALSSDAKLILAILRSLDRAITFDELAVLSTISVDVLRRSAQDLSQGSLLTRTPKSQSLEADMLELSATARAYLPRTDHTSEYMNGVLAREAAYIHDREEHRHAEDDRTLDTNVIRLRTPEDEPTAYLLRLALRFTASNNFDGAEDYIARARSLNPGFFEVDRVEGFLASLQGDIARASARYRTAMSEADSTEHRAAVAHFFAGHLARVGHDVPAAIVLEKSAHDILDNTDTSLALGNFYVWEREFSKGQEYLERALETKSPKMKRIVTTALIDSWRRWAELELDNHQPRAALDMAMSGFYCGRGLIEAGSQDMKFVDSTLRSFTLAIRALVRDQDPSQNDISRIEAALSFVSPRLGLFRSTRGWERFSAALRSVPDSSETIKIRSLTADWPLSVAVNREHPVPIANTGAELIRRGTVVSVRETFGFISHQDYSENIFFHFGAVKGPREGKSLRIGQLVEFSVQSNPEGRLKAGRVESV
jgi:cold shock CspA family protein/tetratricopeptide (TPR) repeat protein